MQRIPLSRASQLHAFIAFLKDVGTPIERNLEKHKLPVALLRDPAMFISNRAMSEFVGDIALREGIDGFGWQIISPTLAQTLARKVGDAPTLFQAINNLCAFANQESTNLKIWYEERGDILYLKHKGSISARTRGFDELSMMRSKVMLTIVRQYIHPEWRPEEWLFEVKCGLPDILLEELSNSHLFDLHEIGLFTIPRELLANRLKYPLIKPTISNNTTTEPAFDLAGSLSQLLKAYPSSAIPSLQDVSSMTVMSPRSLQRRLKEKGTSYRNILMQVKYDQACNYLKQLDLKVIEVSLRLGFEEPAHFTRFFRNFSGQTPSEYRTTITSSTR